MERNNIREGDTTSVEKVADIVLSTDARAIFTYGNPAAVEMTGCSTEKLIGDCHKLPREVARTGRYPGE
ncbi:MAG: hypothetical protein IH987_05365 [Planctomycetes bacterium]|nr:hypothetical protein [Planctomycetota bacterium]